MPASLMLCLATFAAEPYAAPQVTSLTDPQVRYTVPAEHYVVLQRGPVTAVVVDNAEIDSPDVPQHRAGYNGVAVLKHDRRPENLFVPGVAGLNFEHIHDGTLKVNGEKFEPRKFPMQLRVIDPHTVEVYQAPTGNWQLESCGRYELLEDGAIEYTFECIPRAKVFERGFLGLFWASYIHAPEDRSIYFLGREQDEPLAPARWIQHLSPSHGVDSTHPPAAAKILPEVHPEFPLTLVNHPSRFVQTADWYYGVSHRMAYVQIFRPRDRVWLAQSPTGGGPENPAWDFQWFVPDYRVGDTYGFVMRAAYVPFENRDQIAALAGRHLKSMDQRKR